MSSLSPSSLDLNDKLKLESWGLPKYILKKYWSKGLHSMFPWQLECLTSGNVLEGGNLVYSAPTSAGKTLVAEILTLQTVIERKKKVIIILPFVSVVREKMLYFQDLLTGSGIRVEGFMGSYNPPGGFRAVHVAICTIEKANTLINRLLEENNFDNIGCVVVDELHLLSDPHRGYLLELLLTKLRYISKKGLCPSVQIVGMSATLPNLEVLARWLDATLYKTDYRPIPLVEYLKVDHQLYKSPNLVSHETFVTDFSLENDPGDVIYLCIDTIIKGYSVLVFCPTKSWCESLAIQIAGEVRRLGTGSDELALELRKQLNSEAISDTLDQLKNSPAGLESVLGKSVSFGVAYHHAGLTLDERDIIEGGFRRNIIRVLVATSTLSSGVNLPARRVIIRSPLFNGRIMDSLTYKQMIGRAGRMGKDTAGESFLLCSDENKTQGKQLLTSELPPVESSLGNKNLSNSLKRAVLEVIASGLISSREEIQSYTNCTLLAAYEDEEEINKAVQKCMQFLLCKGFITVRNEADISPSPLAEACLSASMTPDQGLDLLAELDNARKCFVLEGDLHAVYQVTPFSVSSQWSLDWMKAFSLWEALPKGAQKVGRLIGVEDRFLIKAMRGTMNFKGENEAHKVAIHKRFFTALALQDLINEIPLKKVADKYGCNKGMLQSLQQSASTFSGMVTNFCRKLSWGSLEVVVSQLAQRIQFGAQRDILDLLRLECMTGSMARGLYNSGITTVSELAQATVKEIGTAIRKALPYANAQDGNTKEKHDIYLPGRSGLTVLEAADVYLSEARSFIMREMGVQHVDWNADKSSGNENDPPTVQLGSNSETISQNVSLGLLVSSADFNHMNVSNDVKIGLSNKTADQNLPIACNEDKDNNGEQDVIDINCQPLKGDKESNDECGHRELDALNSENSIDDNENCFQNSKFSSLLNISNPCIPKIDGCVSPSLSSNDENNSQDIIVSPTQNRGTNEVNNAHDAVYEEEENANESKNITDYQNLHFSNFSNVFGKTFARDSPIEGNKSTTLILDLEGLKSSTPYQTPDSKMSSLTHNDGLQTNKLNGLVGRSVLISQHPSSHTPTSHFHDNKLMGDAICPSKDSPTVSEYSDADIFGDSSIAENQPSSSAVFHGRRLSSSLVCAINSDQPLDEFDSNWGGDSLLLASQVIEEHKDKTLSLSITKRRREYAPSEERLAKKRRLHSAQNSPIEVINKSTNKSSLLKQLTKNLLNTHAENVIEDNLTPIIFHPCEIRNIEPVLSPSVSKTNVKSLSTQDRNSLTDSFLDKAFDDSFKPTENVTTTAPSTPEMFESPQTSLTAPKEILSNYPNTGLVTFDNDRTSCNESLTSEHTLSANKKRKSPPQHFSPSKYPPIGVSFVKYTSSPSSSPHKISLSNSRIDTTVKSCKKSLLDPFDGESLKSTLWKENLKSDQLPLVKDDVTLENRSGKQLRKTKSETWGKYSPAQTDVSERCSAPVTSEPAPDAPKPLDRIDLTKINKTMNVCEDRSQFNTFSTMLLERKETAFCLETTHYSTEGDRIGMKIMRSASKKELTPDFHYANVAILGIYFIIDSGVFYCSLRSSKCACMGFLKSIFKIKDIVIFGFDLSSQMKLLYQCCGIVAECSFWDVGVADWLLNPRDGRNSLKQMVKDYLSLDEVANANLQKTESANDALLIWALGKKLKIKLQEGKLLEPFLATEMPIRLLLVYMELSGMPFEQSVATTLWNRVRETMSLLEELIYGKANRRFNLSSRKDLKKVKEYLNIRPDDQQHPLILNIRNWRKLNSLKTRNLSQLLMSPLSDSRCRGQCSSFTVTGRIIMHEPNLQHIPRDFKVNNVLFSLRSAFVAKSGNAILSADYSQLELRILAHFSEDPNLLSSIINEADVFISIAAKWNNIPIDMVSDEIRHQTKQIIYGIIYGMGDRTLADTLGIDPPEAAMLAAKFRQSYPGVNRFVQQCISNCRKQGYITTLTGRVRWLKGINSPDKSLRAQAERQAVNSTIQGSAADIAKSATIRIEKKLTALIANRAPVLTPLSACHLILHLHDELIYEVSTEYLEALKEIVKTEMTNAVQLKVPLPVVIRCGPSWGQLEKL